MENIEKLLAALVQAQAQQQQQHERQQQQHQELIERLMANQVPAQAAPAADTSRETKFRNLADSMESFIYNPDENSIFDTWYKRYETIFVTSINDWNEPEKIRLLLNKFSRADYQTFADSILPQAPTDLTLVDSVKLLKSLFDFTETKFSMRYKCFSVRIEEHETFKDYGARINKLGEKFDAANFAADDCKTLLFISGLKSAKHSHILEKLLNKVDTQQRKYEAEANEAARAALPKLKVSDLVNEANKIISLKSDKSEISEAVGASNEVNAIRNSYKQTKRQPRSENTNRIPSRPCSFCGENHWDKDCKCKETCATCSVFGHKTGRCKATIDALKRSSSKHQEPSHSVKKISCGESNRKYISPRINGFKVKLQLDSASDMSIVSYDIWKKLGRPRLETTNRSPTSASGDTVQLFGSFKCKLNLKDKEQNGECYVSSRLNLFGSDWMTMFGLWNVPLATVCNVVHYGHSQPIAVEAEKMFPNLFSEGLGLCSKTKASLTLKANAKPIFRKARSAPFAAMPLIEEEILKQRRQNVYSPIEYSDYAAPIVVVKKKNGNLRICGDYSTGLNDALEPNKFPLPTPEQIFTGLTGKKIFSKIDLSDAFLQVELDNEAKKLLTINTHLGLFTVHRLQPGVKTAPGIFQEIMSKMLSGSNGAFAFIDDIVVGSVDEEHHRKDLFDVLSRIEDYGFKLRIDKCNFAQPSIQFCGHIVNKKGIHPDPENIQSIMAIPRPTDITQLRSFLGAVNYYGKFVKNMKDLRGPLDELTQKDVKFEWSAKQENSFSELRKVMASDLVLTHYDPQRKIVVAADASSYGKSGTLMHEFSDGKLRPIFHVSKSFNGAEKNYPQIQREASALVFAVKKFHKYIFGRKFELHTDHQPLLAIFGSNKGIPQVTASRLQRYALTLLAYDFNIKYIRTEDFGYADMMSRLIANHPKPGEDTVIAAVYDGEEQCFAISTANSLPVKFEDVRNAQNSCPVFKMLAQYISNGWPDHKKHITNPEVAKYFELRNSLIVVQDCVFFGDRVVAPFQYREKILETLHEGHPGMVRTKLLARSKVFWPQIDKDIERTVKTCQNCAKAGNSPIKCTLQPWPSPKGPWSRIHIDYAGPIDGFWYLVMVDAYSKWPEIFKTVSTTTSKTTELIDEAFTRNGNCDVIVSDNGPQFTSQAFQEFCKKKGIDHVRTAPYHPQSNGQAEKFVDLLKTGLEKAEGNAEQKLRKFLHSYRSTPSYSLGMKSPAELMNRTFKTELDLLKPHEQKTSKPSHNKMEQQFNSHHGARWKDFKQGAEVYYKLHKTNNSWSWEPATVTKKIGAVNYEVTTSSGRNIKAHANQLKHRFTSTTLDPTNLRGNVDEDEDVQDEHNENLHIPNEEQEDHNASDVFEDAQEEPEEQEYAQPEAQPVVRHSTRENLGVPPIRFGWN